MLFRSSAHRTYSFAAATWSAPSLSPGTALTNRRLSLLATPLLFFPRILSLIFGSLLTVSGDPDGEGKAEVIRQLNVLERSLAGLTGLACLSLAMILIVQVRSSFLPSTSTREKADRSQSGVLPLTSSFASPTGSSPTALLADAPYRTPTVLVATFFFFSLAWYSYDLGMWVVTGVSGGMVIWGAWAVSHLWLGGRRELSCGVRRSCSRARHA